MEEVRINDEINMSGIILKIENDGDFKDTIDSFEDTTDVCDAQISEKFIGIQKTWIVEILKLQQQLLEASKIQKQQLERLQVLTKKSQKFCRRDKIAIMNLCEINKNLMRSNKALHRRNKALIRLKFRRRLT